MVKQKEINYVKDESGNVAIMFAVSLTALLIASGAALDLSDLNNRKSTLQSAADASVLAAAVSGETDIQALTIVAQTAFDSNFIPKRGEILTPVELSLSAGNELNLTAELEKPTLLMQVAGIETVAAKVDSASLLSSETPLDIALVLDRTGSMAGQNMTDLINATRGLINDLDTGDRDIRISIVPFSDYVNIGVNGLPASLLDLPVSGAFGSDVVCEMENVSTSGCTSGSSASSSSSASASSSGGCTTTGTATCSTSSTTTTSSGTTTVVTSSSSSSSGGSTMSWTDVMTTSFGGFCTISPDPQESSGSLVEECTPVRPDENWYGCIGSRSAPYNVTAAFANEKFPLVYNRTCGVPMVPLTRNLVDARRTIDSLTASGSTYIPAGLQWGWRALDESPPFAVTSAGQRNKLLILMTDGQNTRSQDGVLHTGFDPIAANALTAELCNQIKSSNIEIATVSYSNNGTSAGDTRLLQTCASSESLFYEARNAASLRRAFENAIDQSNNVRLIR